MKKGRIITAILSLMLLVSMIVIPSPAMANGPVPVEVLMGFCLDSSGSINSSEWDIMIDGLTSAISDPSIMPLDGSVEMCVVIFGSSSREVFAPIVVTSGTIGTIVSDINGIIRNVGSSTNMAAGINECVASMQKSSNYNTAWKVINLSTDGIPDSQSAAEAAVTAAMVALIQELDAEGIGTGADCSWLAEDIVVPDGPGLNSGPIIGTGYPGTYPPRYPDPGFMGFVRYCENFSDYEEAIREKLVLILKGQLYLEQLTDVNEVNTQHCVTATLLDGYGDPVPGATIHFVVDGANPTSGDAVTGGDGKAQFCYTGTNVGMDTITASAADPDNPLETLTSDPLNKEWIPGEEPPPPIEVGGDVSPVNRISLLAPWIGLAAVALAVAGVTLVLRRRRI